MLVAVLRRFLVLCQTKLPGTFTVKVPGILV